MSQHFEPLRGHRRMTRPGHDGDAKIQKNEGQGSLCLVTSLRPSGSHWQARANNASCPSSSLLAANRLLVGDTNVRGPVDMSHNN
jgi:hypothetical protein